jgi:Gpi18-like mannosyltransferase
VIATSGYEFVNDSKQHNLDVFPLFTVSIWILMKFRLSFELAGIVSIFIRIQYKPKTKFINYEH